jgi:hypothetical protein
MDYFENLPIENLNIPTLIINQEKLDIDIKHFIDNDIIIIESGTATGKTTQISNISNNLKDNKNYILSIVNLISLSREQITNFKVNKITLSDYQLGINDFNNSDGVICINSLSKLLSLEDYDYTNKILYIDEVNDLIQTLTHNEMINSIVNATYLKLIKLIQNCKKIIFTDATINLNVLNLLKSRQTNNKTILIKNEIKKFKDIKAIKYLDENSFLDEIRRKIKNKEYFLFGSDSCERITEFYDNLINEFEDQKDDFLIYTSKKCNKADSNLFKNKYVFYSPTIKTGVSFILKDTKQDHLMYISKKPLCTPDDIYQMSCRTRNMKELKYFVHPEIKSIKNKYSSLSELEEKYKKLIEMNNRLFGLSISRNENDEIKIIENSFFKMFVYNEYQRHIFKTGFQKHYENRLIRDGFKLETIGECAILNSNTKTIYKQFHIEINDKEFQKFNELLHNINSEEDCKILSNDYKLYYDRYLLLGLSEKHHAEQYKILLTDEFALDNYFNTLNLFKNDDLIEKKLDTMKQNTFDIKSINSIYHKVKCLSMFESHYKIKRLDFSSFENIDVSNKISKKFIEYYQTVFPRQQKKQFNTVYDLTKIYANIIKSITGDIPLIISKVVKKDKKCIYKYDVNLNQVKDLIELCKLKNTALKNYNHSLIKQLVNITPDDDTKLINKIDINEYESFRFKKTYKM